jgi:glycine cleavage system H protein
MKLETVHYKRSRFSSRLPLGYRYTSSHYWLRESEPGTWQIGFTKFATRMLGEMVEFEFKVAPGATIETGQVIGWTEGFKALSDIYSAASGEFLGANPALNASITLIDHDPYGEGWLYSVRGQPDPSNMGVDGYIAVLDATIDTMLRSRHDQGETHDG